MRVITYLAEASFFLLIGSCSPQSRLNRIIQNHPEVQFLDSIKIRSQIIVPERSALMSFPKDRIGNLKTDDTISVTKNKITLVITQKNDSLSFDITVPADTIEKDTMVPIKKIIVTGSGRVKKWKRIDWIMFTIIFSGLIYFLTSLIRRKGRND
jgi:hypothetical protein